MKLQVPDIRISSSDAQYQRNVDLVSIEQVEVRQSWQQGLMSDEDYKKERKHFE